MAQESPRTRIAYIVSAHHRPEMAIRLIRRIHAPDHGIFIHYNRRSSDEEYHQLVDALKDLSGITFLPRQKCRWGDTGLVLASLEGIRAIAAGGFVYDYAILLTGADYPIKSDEQIRAALSAANGHSFLEFGRWPIANWEKGKGIRRIHNYHFHPPFPDWLRAYGWQPSWQHITIPARRKLPGSLHPYFGNGFWYLSRACLKYVLDYTAEHPDYIPFFKHVYIPDECFYQCLLMNSPLAPTIQPRSLTYVDWSRKPFPAILNVSDMPRLLQSDCLFARKFDNKVDAAIMDQLDRMLDQPKVTESSRVRP